ncbi:tyrosine-type recombinase/integrase [Alkalibacter mobilis]|uniref:tyrosine-type recombinase/integrase n=1 Tax=Alkalibacter mobilis TaxID=2787712 RepID=UPI0018A09FF2|nr:site-specific integrase [Alkalibacter mobilis]MBF7097356.1 site-specific integrase [Alkalibacter mobilis]
MAYAKRNYKEKYYRVRKTIGGKEIAFYGESKKEAEIKRDMYLDMIKNGIDPNLAEKSLSIAIENWLETFVKHEVKTSSYKRYNGVFKKFIQNSSIGGFRVSDMKSITIQNFYNSLNVTYSQIDNIHKLLNKFFGYAENDGYILRNPCRGVKNPKKMDKKEIEVFTKEEIKRFTSIEHRNQCMIKLLLYTGMRLGECLALTWNDLDMEKCIITINKSVNGLGELTTTKTKSSIRYLVFPPSLLEDLNKKKQLNRIEKMAAGYEDKGLVFPSQLSGNYTNQSRFRKEFKDILKEANVPYRKPHTLRHTFTTRGRQMGYSLEDIARMLGHSTITMTMENYVHYNTEDLRKMVDRMIVE